MRHTYITSQWLPYPLPRVFAFFANPANLPRLMPAWQGARIDAISLVPDSTHSPLHGTLIRGTWPAVARRTNGDMPMPPDFSQGYTSIYALQAETAAKTPR